MRKGANGGRERKQEARFGLATWTGAFSLFLPSPCQCVGGPSASPLLPWLFLCDPVIADLILPCSHRMLLRAPDCGMQHHITLFGISRKQTRWRSLCNRRSRDGTGHRKFLPLGKAEVDFLLTFRQGIEQSSVIGGWPRALGVANPPHCFPVMERKYHDPHLRSSDS